MAVMIPNTTVIPLGYVGANESSKNQIGCGTYSLNKRSNVPFVELVGSAGHRKTISWGETADVPAGETVTVFNASYHGGDIFLNKGKDICNRPSRITVPVPFEIRLYPTIETTLRVWSSKYPCDTRAAKRAYLAVDANVINESLGVFIRGRKLDGSMNCENSLQSFSPPFGPGVGFLSELVYPITDQLSYIPLGMGAAKGDDTRPHTLLDAGDVFFLLTANGTVAGSMEWPASQGELFFPVATPRPAPGTWYVIEYD